MKISVIIPIYNGEKYLKKTIESLLNQSYEDIELILVNDGSTDESRTICESYANVDRRIVLVNKENGGISAARNTGLEYATGEWISFIDQDDEISSDIYNCLISGVDASIDLVVSGKTMLLIDSDSNVIQKHIYNYEDELVIDETKKIDYLFNINRDTRLLHLWNCLYRSEIIKKYKTRFNNNLRFGHEDSLFNVEYVSKCSHIKFLSGMVYTYSRRMVSSTSLKENKEYINDFKVYCDVVGRCIQHLDEETSSKLFTYLFRLGINLVKQYESADGQNSLASVYELASRAACSEIISKNCIDTTYLYCFYFLCALLIKNKCHKLCLWLIRNAPKR